MSKFLKALKVLKVLRNFVNYCSNCKMFTDKEQGEPSEGKDENNGVISEGRDRRFPLGWLDMIGIVW